MEKIEKELNDEIERNSEEQDLYEKLIEIYGRENYGEEPDEPDEQFNERYILRQLISGYGAMVKTNVKFSKLIRTLTEQRRMDIFKMRLMFGFIIMLTAGMFLMAGSKHPAAFMLGFSTSYFIWAGLRYHLELD